ncbi:Uncharacterised protein [Vibrio cholerae]|nr:Uncharacterised protein [Vibrio cholerae]
MISGRTTAESGFSKLRRSAYRPDWSVVRTSQRPASKPFEV